MSLIHLYSQAFTRNIDIWKMLFLKKNSFASHKNISEVKVIAELGFHLIIISYPTPNNLCLNYLYTAPGYIHSYLSLTENMWGEDMFYAPLFLSCTVLQCASIKNILFKSPLK